LQYCWRRGQQMVTDLLDAHRIQAGQPLPLNRVEFDLSAMVMELAEDLSDEFPSRIRVRAPADVRGYWSRDHIQRAVWNLVLNGIKYGAPDSGVVIEIHADTTSATISVHNEGPPIPKAAEAKLFESFSCGRTAETGWGLGLALVRGAVEAHGGCVGLE